MAIVDRLAQILAAFSAPNDPVVERILKDAARLLERHGHSGSLDGYQSGNPARAYMLAAAIWSSVSGMGLTYAEPPPSFELRGQKVRDPGRIAESGLATCLDTSLLLAAALEATGLNPIIVFTEGHAFAGVWLTQRTFASLVEADVTELRKAIAARELHVFETTLLTQRPSVGFDQAISHGSDRLSDSREAEFDRAIDIRRARSAGIRPLASHRVFETSEGETNEVTPAVLPPIPDFGQLPGEEAEEVPRTPEGRIERWQRRLLDLSLRNKLLNFKATKQSLPLRCPNLSALEDQLAEGGALRIISLEDENPVGERNSDQYRRETGQDIITDFAAEQLARGSLCVPLSGQDMTGRLTNLFRQAKSDLAEGGTNTLFLALGFLRWKQKPDDARTFSAPLLLVPVKLVRKSAQSTFQLAHHEDEVRFNATLLQFLEQDFAIRVPRLASELPEDQAGTDVPGIFALLRAAVRDVPGFEVVEEAAVGTFSFAKYLMWKDLVDRTESLRQNRFRSVR